MSRAAGPGHRHALAAIPLAALAVGAVYSYSFAGLLWPVGAAGLWALLELALAARRDPPVAPLALARRAASATGRRARRAGGRPSRRRSDG